MFSARLLSSLVCASSLLSACAGNIRPSAEANDAGEVDVGDDGEQVDAGSLLDGAVVDDGSSQSDAASGTTTTVDGGRSTCGDVTAAAHPPFAAIRKLATTRDEVRVLVYGQSISEQTWWSKTKAWLERTYPNGNLVMEQHAHGGCPSQCLIGHEAWFSDGSRFNRLPEDVFAFRPDLIIFHVYGDHHDYQYIMRAFKEGCAAFDDYRAVDGSEQPQVKCTPAQRMIAAGYRAPEVLVQNDFPQTPAMLSDCPANVSPRDNWSCFMNERVIPEQVTTYGYRLQDNFHEWPDYIAQHGVSLQTLVADDDTHLRDPGGTDLMFEMTIPHLCYAPQ